MLNWFLDYAEGFSADRRFSGNTLIWVFVGNQVRFVLKQTQGSIALLRCKANRFGVSLLRLADH